MLYFSPIFVTFLSFLSLVNLANAQGVKSLDGVWVNVMSGCNLQLSESELKHLRSGAAQSNYGTLVLYLSEGSFNLTQYRGSACASSEEPIQYLPNDLKAMWCGGTVSNSGKFVPTDDSTYNFIAKNIESYLGYSLPFGVERKDAELDVLDGILRITTESIGHQIDCPYSNKWISYYVLSPTS